MQTNNAYLFVDLAIFFPYFIFTKVYPGIIDKWWMLDNLSGIRLIGVPFEEFLWAFGMGMMTGPLYEFIVGLKF